MTKREAEQYIAGEHSKKLAAFKPQVNRKRWISLNQGNVGAHTGPVVYWCSRDQRVNDNWALLHCADLAQIHDLPVAVVFNLVTSYLGAGARQFTFMLKGLQQMEQKLKELNIPFYLLQGDPCEEVPKFVKEMDASVLVTDFAPLRIGRMWRTSVADQIDIPMHEVDAHNVVPVWETSPKLEYAARTIRSKIHKQLPTFLREFPAVEATKVWDGKAPPVIEWNKILTAVAERGSSVPEVTWCQPGEEAAFAALKGKENGFLTKSRMGLFDSKRNNPNIPEALSNLSPYIHFGQLSAQRCALEAIKYKKVNPSATKAVESYLEELVVRRELSDNFCYYNKLYDSIEGAHDWARQTLQVHAKDRREHVYTREQFESGKTHDNLWNAAQLEMVHFGKMHGFMRMYWAKKILEWSTSPKEALATAIYLNDKYQLDGRDPNGYVGCMWSICGIHDQGWREREVFGKIRYMNYQGCKRKFDVDAYVQRIKRHVKSSKYFCE